MTDYAVLILNDELNPSDGEEEGENDNEVQQGRIHNGVVYMDVPQIVCGVHKNLNSVPKNSPEDNTPPPPSPPPSSPPPSYADSCAAAAAVKGNSNPNNASPYDFHAHVQRCVERVGQTKIPIELTTPLTPGGVAEPGNGGKKSGFTLLEKSILFLVTILFCAILFTGSAIYVDGVEPIINLVDKATASLPWDSSSNDYDWGVGNFDSFNPPPEPPLVIEESHDPFYPLEPLGPFDPIDPLDQNLGSLTPQNDGFYDYPIFNTKDTQPSDPNGGGDPDPKKGPFDSGVDNDDPFIFDDAIFSDIFFYLPKQTTTTTTTAKITKTTTTKSLIYSGDFDDSFENEDTDTDLYQIKEEPLHSQQGDEEDDDFDWDSSLYGDDSDEIIPDFKFDPPKKTTTTTPSTTTTTTRPTLYDDFYDDDDYENGGSGEDEEEEFDTIFDKKKPTDCSKYFGLEAQLTQKMNQDVSPCSDFYEHACGGWIASHREFDVATELAENNLVAILAVLNNGTRDSLSEAEWQAKMFYRSCIYAQFNSDPIYEPQTLNFDQPQVKKCLYETVVKFEFVAAAMLYHHTKKISPESLSLGKKMTGDIRHQFISSQVMNSSWMKKDLKIMFPQSILASKDYVGFPNFVLTSKSLDDHYASLEEMKRGEYTGNLDKINNFQNSLMSSSLWQTYGKYEQDWTMPSTTVGVVEEVKFDLETRNFLLPLGILQPPFFHPCHPDSVNFGALGTILGHGIGHGFYEPGGFYDQFGDFQPWDSLTQRKFKNLANCLVDQFWDLNVNGDATLTENVADGGGLRASFYAYRKRVERATSRKKFNKLLLTPELQLSQDQLFFLAYAQNWCVAPTTTSKLNKDEVHAPHKARVLSVLRDSPEFSKAYNCPLNSPMNPEKKCTGLW